MGNTSQNDEEDKKILMGGTRSEGKKLDGSKKSSGGRKQKNRNDHKRKNNRKKEKEDDFEEEVKEKETTAGKNKSSGSSIDKLLRKGKGFLDEKKYENAEICFLKVLEKSKDEIHALFGLGFICRRGEQRLDEAFGYFNKVITVYKKNKKEQQLDSDSESSEEENDEEEFNDAKIVNNSYFLRGKIFVIKKKLDKAIKDFSKVINKKDSVPVLNDRGITYLYKKEYENALLDFSRALELQSCNHTALSNRGKCYFIIEHYTRAIKDLSQALEIKKDWRTYYNRAFSYKEIKDYQRAILDLESILKNESFKKGASEKTKTAIESALKKMKALRQKEIDDRNNKKKRIVNIEIDEFDNDFYSETFEEDENLFKEDMGCKICYERKNDIALSCGHCVCSVCSYQISEKCPFCAKKITGKVKLFLV